MDHDVKERVAIVGTGGTISSLGDHPLELVTYINKGKIFTTAELVEAVPVLSEIVEPVLVPFSAMASTDITPEDWLALAQKIDAIPNEYENIKGVVVTHGTATLEETAWFLNLVLKISIPVVVVGSQRPYTGLSSDSPINLVNATRVAKCDQAIGMGVLVCLNDEIQCARDATKTSTFRMQTFRSPDFGALGHADHDGVNFYRKPVRRCAPDTEFDVATIDSLPRVDIVYAYVGADETLVQSCVAAGARAIVVAAFAPGLPTRKLYQALEVAASEGVVVVFSSRAGSGRVTPVTSKQPTGTVVADNLNPQKARILTMLALTKTSDPVEIQKFFERY